MILSLLVWTVLALSPYIQVPVTHPLAPQPQVPLHQISREQSPLESYSQSAVSLPHANPTKSFWTHGASDANPLAKEGSKGLLTADADVVIIGAGITGVGAAYHLSRLLEKKALCLRIVIIEARDFCAGATGRNGGHLTPTLFQGFRSVAETYNTDEALRWLMLENHTTEAIISILKSSGQEREVDLVHGGHMNLFFSDEAEQQSRTDWTAAVEAGVDLKGVKFLSKNSTQKMFGPAFPSVLYSGYNLWPLKVVTHFFKIAQQILAASNRGSRLHLHTQTPVTSIERLHESFFPNTTSLPRRWLLETPRGPVRAHTIIHATNGYAAYLLPFLAATHGREGIGPTRGQVIATRASVGANTLLEPSYSANDGYEYWFPRPVNKSVTDGSNSNPLVILGGGREAGGPDYELGVTDDSVINPIISETLKRFLPEVYPDGWFDKDRKPEHEWTGIMGFTKSRDPFVGPVLDTERGIFLDGQYIAAGYSGHGMTRAFGCAEALVQLVMADLTNETWEAPEWFPDHFLTTSTWRANAFLKTN